MPQNEKNAKPIGGPGGHGGHGPRPNVKNPGKLFMRLLSYIMKNYAVHCVIVVICIFITVLASVQGTLPPLFPHNLYVPAACNPPE